MVQLIRVQWLQYHYCSVFLQILFLSHSRQFDQGPIYRTKLFDLECSLIRTNLICYWIFFFEIMNDFMNYQIIILLAKGRQEANYLLFIQEMWLEIFVYFIYTCTILLQFVAVFVLFCHLIYAQMHENAPVSIFGNLFNLI